ncbi:MAG: hypothetical protein HOV94_02915 [Saccharothrix sp.]|nr:hypothetical protein [Saccharothrix sp.]
MNHNEEQAKARRRFTERLACTLAFTAVMVWAAAVIIVKSEVGGVVAFALAFVLAGGLVAVHDAWRDVRSVRRELDVEIREELVRL